MDRPSYATITAALKTAEVESLPPLHLTILRNVVVEPMETYLRYLALGLGLHARCQVGQYDNVVQEAVGGCPALLNDATDCVVVFLQLDTLAWALARDPLALGADQLAAEKGRIKELVTAVAHGIRRQTPALILWAAFETPLYPALGILDYQDPNGQNAVVAELNGHLRDCLRALPAAYVLDINACLARIGAARFYDARYWHIAKAPYSRQGMEELAYEIVRYLRPLKGKSKKCVVVDCDGVLWGGILGEDGFDGIKLGPTYPGSMYAELQQELLSLHRRGLLLAICSRNNAADVWEVFDRHPDMLLRREHIAAAQINWGDKATNVRQIALDLNIGLDSLVFLDDSAFEAELVRQLLPAVQVVHLPKERAGEFRGIVAGLGCFDALTVSREDRQRTAMYHAEQGRERLRADSTDLTGYYASLEMVLSIRRADAFTIPRIAQLTQKTNQFNLTTRRYSEAEIQQLSERRDTEVVSVHLSDRFGDMGVVGVCILKYDDARVAIDTLLLSCRALGRGVETATLFRCLTHARARGCHRAVAEYRPTAKNGQVEDFYPRHGFSLETADAAGRSFCLDLATFDRVDPTSFARIESDLDREGDTATAQPRAKERRA